MAKRLDPGFYKTLSNIVPCVVRAMYDEDEAVLDDGALVADVAFVDTIVGHYQGTWRFKVPVAATEAAAEPFEFFFADGIT